MARPKRSKPASEKKPSVTTDPVTEETIDDTAPEATVDEVDERDKELKELRALLAKREKAADQLKEDLKAANDRAAEAGVSNEDFREKPPNGTLWYYIVRFDPKRTEGDTEMVEAAVNGDWMTWNRRVETVLRSDYKEVLENAVTAKFTVLPGEDRKDVGSIQTYTFNVLKRIDKEEYGRRLADGNAKLKASSSGA